MTALGDAIGLRVLFQFRGVIEMVYAKHYDFQSQCMNETKGGDFRFSRVCTLIFVAMSLLYRSITRVSNNLCLSALIMTI